MCKYGYAYILCHFCLDFSGNECTDSELASYLMGCNNGRTAILPFACLPGNEDNCLCSSCRKCQCCKYVIKRLIRTHLVSRLDIFQRMHMKFYRLCLITGFEDINVLHKHVGNLISKQPHVKGILIL